jgi:TrmH family RNA methyltransferase
MIGEITLRRGDCFVIGNEGHGLSKGAIDACDGCAIIPMREGSESLNAAAAAAICIWETVRAK